MIQAGRFKMRVESSGLIVNSINRKIPAYVNGYGEIIPFKGAFKSFPERGMHGRPARTYFHTRDKVKKSIREAVQASGLENGMTISFHHHLRNGDKVLNLVLEELSEMGFKNLRLAPTALFKVHTDVIRHIESGLITSIHGSINGPVGRKVSEGCFNQAVVLRSHGGRARAIEAGELRINVAFIAAPSSDRYGNLSGTGRSSCGAIGYAVSDAQFADHVIAVTDNLADYPLLPASIDQIFVDSVVKVESIGDPNGIVSGTTRITADPARLEQADIAARLLDSAGVIKQGFSFQTGAGGTSLAVTKYVADIMREKKIKGSFGSGGITGYFVDLLEEGLFDKLLDVQSFDLRAVKSIGENHDHVEMSASMYANPHNSGCVVNMLDAVVLGATEVDTSFNVNVNTEFDGALMHGIGGHQDTAAGAGITIVTLPLIRGRIPSVVENVITVTSPGETVDVIITDRGTAINPKRTDLIEAASRANIHTCSIEELQHRAEKLCGKPEPLRFTDNVIGVIEYRDGTVIDVVRQVEQ
jgi:citrate lyase subunit alpha/citrate CoA-transferase